MSEDMVWVSNFLLAQKLTISAAESVSVGKVQALLASRDGASQWFRGGLCAYSLDSKVRLLDVEPVHAESVNCVSATVAEQMATGVAKAFQTDVGISTTGFVTPHVAPYAFVGIYFQGASYSLGVKPIGGSREQQQEDYAFAAIYCLCKFLKDVEGI